MSISNLLNQTITLTAQGEQDKFGKASFSSGTDYNARFERTNKTIHTKENTVEPIDGVVFLSSDVTVSLGDRIVYDSQTYRVMKISEPPIGNGVIHHKELLVQEWNL